MLGGARHIKDAELAISAGDGDPTTVMRHVYAVDACQTMLTCGPGLVSIRVTIGTMAA